MSDIVELIAQAICDRATDKNHWGKLDDSARGFFRKEARAAIAALDAAGFAIVPKEPTEAMLQAGSDAWGKTPHDFDEDDWRASYVSEYRAMLAVSQLKGA